MVASFFAAGGVLIWTYLCLYTEIIKSMIGTHFNYEIFWYVCSFFIFLLLFIAVKTVEKRFLAKTHGNAYSQNGKYREICLEILFGVIIAIAMIAIFLKEPLMEDAGSFIMPWHAGRRIEKLLILLGILLSFQYRRMLATEEIASHRKNNYVVWYLLLAFAAGHAVYHPNFLDSYYNAYHLHAYFNSVNRVLNFQPYDMLNSGVYGFYGIIQMPFVKILGGDYFAFSKLMGIVTIITVFCFCYVLDYVADNDLLKILGSIAIATPLIALSANMYLQLWPHRIFMASLVLAFMCFCKKHELDALKWKIMGAFLCALSVVWSLETGVGCVLAYIGADIVCYLQSEKTGFLKKMLSEAAKAFLLVAAGWLFVGLYNLSVGGRLLTLKEFLFPLVGSNTFMNKLNIPLSRMPGAWMMVCMLFFTTIAVVLGSTVWAGEGYRDDRLVIMAACVICVAIQMMYYINRAVWGNLFIVLPVSGILLAGLVTHFSGENIWKKYKLGNGIKRVISVAALLSLSAVTMMTATNYLTYEGIRVQSRDISAVKKCAKKIRKKVPRDTLAIGIGLPEIYSILGWKTGYYGIDMADMWIMDQENYRKVEDIVMGADEILIEDSALASIMSADSTGLDTFHEEYEEQFNYSLGFLTYRLWTKKSG